MANSSVFSIQDPERPGGTLLDAIADAAEGADRGGGIFAFATSRGIDMLLGDSALTELINEHGFRIVVGVDSITDERALKTLANWADRHDEIRSEVFVNEQPWMFHPKLCWFGYGDRVTALVGSGNLTKMGLTTNYEAFVTSTLEGQGAVAVETEILNWLSAQSDRLFPPTADEALEQAKKNSGSERSLRKPMASEEEPEDTSPAPDPDAEVLIVQVPKNAPRRMQLDVGIDQYRDFFGGVPGRPKRIQIHHVDADGQPGEPEPPRALFRTKSTNFRFEARPAGVNLEYPAEGRPIGVFVRMPNGVFRYVLLRPGDAGHSELTDFLTDRVDVPHENRMRRITIDLGELADVWPASPLLKMPDEAD